MNNCSFRLESEICSRRFAGSYSNFLGLISQFLLPGCDRVTARRNAMDCVRAAFVGGRVGALDHSVVAVHPGMNVAFHRNNFRRFPTGYYGRRSRRMRLVPWDIASHSVWQGMDVVGSLVAGSDLKFLARVQGQNVRNVLATLLVKGGFG